MKHAIAFILTAWSLLHGQPTFAQDSLESPQLNWKIGVKANFFLDGANDFKALLSPFNFNEAPTNGGIGLTVGWKRRKLDVAASFFSSSHDLKGELSGVALTNSNFLATLGYEFGFGRFYVIPQVGYSFRQTRYVLYDTQVDPKNYGFDSDAALFLRNHIFLGSSLCYDVLASGNKGNSRIRLGLDVGYHIGVGSPNWEGISSDVVAQKPFDSLYQNSFSISGGVIFIL